MGNTWGRKVPLKEVLRKNKREINKAVRELDRERANLEKQEQKLVADIKKYAKDGQMGPVKIMAKDLVRTRTYITKFIELRSHLNAVALKLQTVKSQEAMARAMKSVTEAMVRMNKTVNICVEINQCVGCTKSFLGDDAAGLARSSGEEPTLPCHRAGGAAMAWRAMRGLSPNAP